MNHLYKRFIEPRQSSEDLRNRELVLNVLVAGTIVAFFIAFCILLANLPTYHYVLGRTIIVGVGLLLAFAIYHLSRARRQTLAAIMLIMLYGAIATGIIYTWGVTMPTGVLLFGLLITMAGVLLGARAIPYAVGSTIVISAVVRTLQVENFVKPNWSAWAQQPLNAGTFIGCCIIFGILATVSWLYTSQIERSLKRARRAEAALRRQKELLEVIVEQRTKELQDAQLEKVQQMYKFAELGQLSTALLHDLANHLTTLSLDIEGLGEQTRSSVLRRVKRSIHYIDEMVARVRDQLHGRALIKQFNLGTEIEEIVSMMNHRAQTSHVRLIWEATDDRKQLKVRGEPIRFRQLLTNLIGNAIDAYDDNITEHREVRITAKTSEKKVVITVNDWGKGVPIEDRSKLFEPFFSTKKTGMGMGLFIAKQICKEQFDGDLELDDTVQHTAFVITLARG